MKMPSHYEPIWRLEQALGDPAAPNNTISFKSAVALDEQDAFPGTAMELLYQLDLPEHYIPHELGGTLVGYDALGWMARVLARRDMTIAVACSTLVWSTIAWVGGTPEQKRRLVEQLRHRDYAPCLAYSEAEHGADLIASDVTATRDGNAYRVSGEKWPINRATRSGLVALLARTSEERTSRSLSLFLVEKEALNPAAYWNLPRVPTLGLRGCDISGIGFDDARVPASCRIGAEGEGLEIALKAFQVTRTLSAGLSLGAADTALRSTLNFALDRRLYGRRVYDIPSARAVLIDGLLDILVGEAVTLSASRALHVCPSQCSIWSAVAKYLVPTTLERTMHELSVILGARYYMRSRHDWGIFQKMLRDGAIVSLFDGSTAVNLHALSSQLRALAKRHAAGRTVCEELSERLRQTFHLNEAPPVFDGKRLDLFGHGQDDLMAAFALLPNALQSTTSERPVDPEVLAAITELTERFTAEQDEIYRTVRDNGRRLEPQSHEIFELSKRYCTVHAAAACLWLWLHNRADGSAFLADGRWLVGCLERLALRLRPGRERFGHLHRDAVAAHLEDAHTTGRMFSLIDFPLSSAGQYTEEGNHEYASEGL